jgi:hypothetical protein
MAAIMDRAECSCGCYVNIRNVLAKATREAEDRPLRAVIIVGDAFHDDPDGLAARRDDGLPERRRAGPGKAAYAVVPD